MSLLSITPPESFFEKLRLPKFHETIQHLRTKVGRDFERAVCTAFNFLDFDASLTQTTQAESDVIAEAYYAEKPYFIVVECQAVRPQNQVGVDKVGQIRGNAEAYSLDPRRQRLFETSHKLIVGRPAFSSDARSRSHPDVGLITVDSLVNLMSLHKRFLYSQDELEEVLGVSGEITTAQISRHYQSILGRRQHDRKMNIYSLIYIALLEDPISDNLEKRRNWVSLDTVIGTVLTYGSLFRILNLTEEEVADTIRDLNNPFLPVLRRRVTGQGRVEVRLSTISRPVIQTSSEYGNMLSLRIAANVGRLRALVRGAQPTMAPTTRPPPRSRQSRRQASGT